MKNAAKANRHAAHFVESVAQMDMQPGDDDRVFSAAIKVAQAASQERQIRRALDRVQKWVEPQKAGVDAEFPEMSGFAVAGSKKETGVSDAGRTLIGLGYLRASQLLREHGDEALSRGLADPKSFDRDTRAGLKRVEDDLLLNLLQQSIEVASEDAGFKGKIEEATRRIHARHESLVHMREMLQGVAPTVSMIDPGHENGGDVPVWECAWDGESECNWSTTGVILVTILVVVIVVYILVDKPWQP